MLKRNKTDLEVRYSKRPQNFLPSFRPAYLPAFPPSAAVNGASNMDGHGYRPFLAKMLGSLADTRGVFLL